MAGRMPRCRPRLTPACPPAPWPCRADGPAGHGTGRAAGLLAARPVVAAGTPPALARRRIPPRRRRRRPARRRRAETGRSWAWTWKTPWPTTTRSTAAPSSSRATRSSSTARDSARCDRWSAWWPTRNGNGPAASTCPTKLDAPDHAAARRQRQAKHPGRRPDRRPAAAGPAHQAGPGRALQRDRSAGLPRRASSRSRIWRSSARARSKRPKWPSSPAAPTPPSPGRTPRPCRSSSIARPPWPK